MKKILGSFSLAIILCFSQFASAGTISPGIFELFNHPDGNADVPGPYGLRLDYLPPPGHGPTYDVEADASPVTLTWYLDGTAVIEGRIKNNASGEFWKVTYSMSGLTEGPSGFSAAAGSGSLMYDDVGVPKPDILLAGDFSMMGTVFDFFADGYRLPPAESMTTVGRGWLLPSTIGPHNDWLVIGVQTTIFMIPEPATLALLIVSISAIQLRRRGTV
ncbi:MAG: PEP-CTERM sorting domain-containing protein [Bythopirellula sp.]|nr:PEP-CTERM sorting domain-containing protein [Bythopirellula sp.]